jgi:hypothetical protein
VSGQEPVYGRQREGLCAGRSYAHGEGGSLSEFGESTQRRDMMMTCASRVGPRKDARVREYASGHGKAGRIVHARYEL